MRLVSDANLGMLELTLSWEHADMKCRERYLARKVNFWRDVFPKGLREALDGRGPGESATMTYAPGEALPGKNPRNAVHARKDRAEPLRVAGRTVPYRLGGFYPRGRFGGAGFFPGDARPARIVEEDARGYLLDCDHPLAGKGFSLTAEILELAPKASDTGGRLYDWLEEIATYGPGMQAPLAPEHARLGPEGYRRLDASQDAFFYAAPRLVAHIDRRADDILTGLYAGHLRPGMRVLDLMSGPHSHLPADMDLAVAGIGMNAEEMRRNPALSAHLEHDLNANPALPFPDGAFDAVLCSLSVEYLLDPVAVFAECARVLEPGGVMLTSFSNRWFPEKCVTGWMDLHEFERLGLVAEHYRRAGAFGELETVSARNWFRPLDDPHIRQTLTSDPVYMVKAVKTAGGGGQGRDRGLDQQ
mgnify:CR=1 FL=1